MKVLVLNVGSSSVKFELIETSLEAIQNGTERKLGRGLVDKIGMTTSTVKFQAPGKDQFVDTPNVPDHQTAIKHVLSLLCDPKTGAIANVSEIEAVGHRVVHGGEDFVQSTLIDDAALEKIRECFELAPLHNPHNYKGIRLMQEALPNIPHVAVFDTSFHQTMPKYAYIYALPYEVYQKYKVRRYGFHGTSHRYMTYALETRFAKKPRKEFKAITVHLGNGCSLAAVDGGRSIDTSMGFTPLEGLIMGTRCGDVDPAVILYLMAKEDHSLQEMNTILNKFSGLKGISGVSNDMRELVAAMREGNERATLAVRAFAYRVRKYIGAYHAALGGADYIAFAGGIGENSPLVRELILDGMEKLGIILDKGRNNSVGGTGSLGGEITAEGSPIRAFVVPTDEELVIARDTVRCIAGVL
ncbi:MAG: acetate kinase [Candidatus Hydrogenedentota bacterium]|uniref:Acetate kinase n=1 Tax=Sumerlaea chitinivorans TaxID=2250252 RepID=A0A2Z4Y650_SUMC1|nr:Acetate kinase [Candidatus Sumerlaea chitinivorans]RMH26190.1 MAG: acetate kinase [Candidatus Hydrogenedentota bacterium]GIX44127.1 MAG: acetate kinase [Candidatus Sumerlaea sp.]